jgi:hypothetical protein
MIPIIGSATVPDTFIFTFRRDSQGCIGNRIDSTSSGVTPLWRRVERVLDTFASSREPDGRLKREQDRHNPPEK